MDDGIYITTKVLKMKIIDAHTHIDRITQNFQTDVCGCICCATNESDWQKIIDLMKSDNHVYGAFGVHPWFVEDVKDDFDLRLRHVLKTNSNYMVGEIGLDKHKPNMEHQIDIFIKQFNVAVELNRIVSLHCVGAWDKMLYILKQYKNKKLPKIIVHRFDENEKILAQLLQYENVCFSLYKNAVYGKNCRIEQIPNNKILAETDADKDCLLKDIVLKISDIKNDENMPKIIYDNTKQVLNNE
jgi:TatD DNase family protein